MFGKALSILKVYIKFNGMDNVPQKNMKNQVYTYFWHPLYEGTKYILSWLIYYVNLSYQNSKTIENILYIKSGMQ